MLFNTDKQTIRDLNLVQDRSNDRAVFSIYNHTVTRGGQEMMNKLFRTPVSDLNFLRNRKDEINFFFTIDCVLKLKSRHLDSIEHYLNIDRNPLRNNIIDATWMGLINKISENGDYWIISNGILHTVSLLIDLAVFIKDVTSFSVPETLGEDFGRIDNFLASKIVKRILTNPPKDVKNLTFSQISNIDYFLRSSNKVLFRELLSIVYKIDVLQTLSRIMKSEGFTLPEYCESSQPVFELSEAFFPLLPSPVPTTFTFNKDAKLCFVTGPNMAGKSTFLRTMGLMIYLSHLGFPVPAKRMKTTVFDGLFTTINLADNLNLGYSHFNAEVQRVKDIVLKINPEQKLFVIFDELFRGTNVKDAYDASLLIISELAKIRGNLFFISTHILEVAENLQNKDSILFKCFESELVDKSPVYDYKLKEGVSKERIGMIIIKRENIIGILEQIIEKQNSLISSSGTNE